MGSSGSNCEIDSVWYNAALEGEFKTFKQKQQHLDLLVTPIKNTVLHIYFTSPSQTQKSTEFVRQILQICPSLLLQVNANGDTPLHFAAKNGDSAIVEILIERAKAEEFQDLENGVGAVTKTLRMKNNEGNTALHEAVRTDHLNVVKVLTKEDPEFSYSANDYGETPLFVAAAGGSIETVAEILQTCKSAAHEGPLGKTVLHAAVIRDDRGITRKILEKKKSLIKETDQNGWTPLHYAAYYGSISSAQQLLEVDRSVEYMVDKDKKMTALHLAASQGREKIMKEIINRCPDCCEIVNNRGWNFLHFAMISLSVTELNSFLRNSLFSNLIRNLINTKDVKGNTPLHVLAAFRSNSWENIMKEVGGYVLGFNKQSDSASDILWFGSPELKATALF